jgi:hypothetical protein
VPPDPRPIPRFIADSSQEGIPSGRFADRLGEHFEAACEAIGDLPEEIPLPETIDWFPERVWGGRAWVPATARSKGPEGEIEFYGHVSYVQAGDDDPSDFQASADFTDIVADDNPDWRIDLNDDVIGRWRGEAGMGGDVTLVWGRPMVPGAVAATAEVETATVDQEPISNNRFTLIALDALEGYGDDLLLEVKLWSRRARELAAESLYDDGPDPEPEAPAGGEGEDAAAAERG